MAEKFDFEAALKAVQSGQSITVQDSRAILRQLAVRRCRIERKAPCPTADHSLTGRRTENVVPTPTSDVTSIWPPSVRT
jgi:hypothetical protein